MPPLYRLIEVAIYSLLNFLPFLALALYPFRHSLRFSRRVTAVLIALVTAGQLLLGAWAAFWSNGKAGTVSAVSTVLYALFYFLAVKKHFGKTLFTLLMISNIANFAVISGKCLEGLLFPQLALQSYRCDAAVDGGAAFHPPCLLYEAVLHPRGGKRTVGSRVAVSVADPRHLLRHVVFCLLWQQLLLQP